MLPWAPLRGALVDEAHAGGFELVLAPPVDQRRDRRCGATSSARRRESARSQKSGSSGRNSSMMNRPRRDRPPRSPIGYRLAVHDAESQRVDIEVDRRFEIGDDDRDVVEGSRIRRHANTSPATCVPNADRSTSQISPSVAPDVDGIDEARNQVLGPARGPRRPRRAARSRVAASRSRRTRCTRSTCSRSTRRVDPLQRNRSSEPPGSANLLTPTTTASPRSIGLLRAIRRLRDARRHPAALDRLDGGRRARRSRRSVRALGRCISAVSAST